MKTKITIFTMMIKKLSVLLLGSLFVAGCYNEQTTIIDSSAALPFTLGHVTLGNGLTKSTSTVTTGTIDVSSLDGSSAVTASRQYSYSNSKWNIVSGTSLTAPVGTNVCAYYPYNSNITDRTAIPLTSGVYSSANDLSYGYATTTQQGTSTSTTASIALNRAYAKVTFNFCCGNSSPLFTTVTSLSITNADIISSSTLNITSSTGTYGTATKSSVTINPGLTLASNTIQSVTLLMIPTTLVSTSNLVVSLTVGSSNLNKIVNIPVSSITNNKLEAGKEYHFNIDSSVSAIGLAESNCYMVDVNKTIYIPVSRAVAGNAAIGYVATGGGTTAFSAGDPFTAGVLWSDVAITDRTATVFGQYIKVTTGATTGNFVVYAMKGSSIVWSWHIWVSDYIPAVSFNGGTWAVTIMGVGTVPYYGGQYWMDRDLGATTSAGNSQTSLGLYYQWGRKDPFPRASGVSSSSGKTIYLPQNITYPSGSSGVTNDNQNVVYNDIGGSITLANQSLYAVKYPLMFLNSWAGSSASAANGTTAAGGVYSWCASDNKKTIFDPCPSGWRTPISTSYASSPWNSFGTSLNAYSSGASWDAGLYGMSVTSPTNAATFYPAAGYRAPSNNGSITDIPTMSAHLSGSANSANASYMLLSSSLIRVYYAVSRAMGCNVRCVQE